MALFFTTTLGISVAGLLLLMVLKRWELSTGHILGGRARPKAGAFVHRVLSWFEYALPELVHQWARQGYARVWALLHRLAALSVVVAENILERLLRLLRHKTALPQDDSQASSFLREVSAHKAQLIKRARTKRAIYEE